MSNVGAQSLAEGLKKTSRVQGTLRSHFPDTCTKVLLPRHAISSPGERPSVRSFFGGFCALIELNQLHTLHPGGAAPCSVTHRFPNAAGSHTHQSLALLLPATHPAALRGMSHSA